MPKFTRNFTAGKMNKTFDERVVPNGEYIDAMNIRMGSTENSEFGVIENTKGNISLTTLKFQNTLLSVDARCIGAYEDGSIETIYWFVHDPSFPLGNTGKLDLVVSFNTNTFSLTYHVITIDNGGGVDTTLNFDPQYLITGVNKIEDLLFFTDNYNAPRSINVTRNYAIPSGAPLIDAGSTTGQALLEESLLVIKKPPSEAPTVQLIDTAGEQNFLEERFISFAYRYLYADGQYSATSQWSDIAFSPNGFELTVEAYLNEGMINSFNACQVTYYTGNSLVLGIDLLFKQSESNIIKIIEKQNKADLGIPNNTLKTLTFDNSKIFTVLPEAELLRLYDNVPRFAQAQTLMGNRLMYGNYIEGYDLVSTNGQPLQLTYVAKLMQDTIGSATLDSSAQNSVYTIDGNHPVPLSILRIDFASLASPSYESNLIAGATIQVKLEFAHYDYTGGMPTTQTGNTSITSTFTLASTYLNPFALSQSVEFKDWIGTLANILPVYNANPAILTSCSGITFTDAFNCNIPANQASGWQKRASGITAINQPIKIIATNIPPDESYIDLQLVAMQYEDINLGGFAYEYYSVVSSLVTFNRLGNARSLHSNRGYEIGIVYMDDFLRSSTALVSPDNIVYTPCSSSPNKNSIQVAIPVSQVAPYWATRYKFVIKPDQEGYQTVYSTLVTQDADSLIWFLLEGENMQKVEVGDRLIVKKDSSGPTTDCLYTTVLEKISKAKSTAFPIAGVYMRLEAGNFDSQVSPIPTISQTNSGYSRTKVVWSETPLVPPAVMYTDLDVPVGSVIGIMAYTYIADDYWTGCSKKEINPGQNWSYFTATQSYANLEAWFTANTATIVAALQGASPPTGMSVSYIGYYTLSDAAMLSFVSTGTSRTVMKLYINRDPADNLLKFWMTGTKPCDNDDDNASTILKFSLQRSPIEPDFIFETLPIDALPDVFFENNLSFPISPIGEHDGNVQDQNFALGQDAIVDTGFFNCFSFGNGVESYKVRDSIVGREFNLGERVTSVSAQDYKEAHRFSDITYSGIYNTESNLNKLNEFNLGLLNYKYLESSFGYIYVLDGRETDVLCLQEDKISYVLAGKNLLSDAGAGRALTAVPEVLGTQIARTEKYGISHNPESYVQWGADRYFTDTKKGAVIHIQGDSMQSDQLRVVSEFGMRTWFRDEFINAQTTQKLGGYDPYMNEYVLTSNDIQVPSVIECIGCGQINSFNIDNIGKPERIISYCVKLNNCIADGNIVLQTGFVQAGGVTVDVTYDGTTTTSGFIDTGQTINIPYSVNNPIVLELQIVITITAGANLTFDIDNQCQDCNEIFLVEVVITDGSNAGMFIHNQYNYFDPLIPYSSPLQSNQVTFALPSSNPLVSYYNIDAGFWGQGSFPYPGVDMNLYTNKIGIDDFDVTVPPNKFLYHTSNTNYPNNPASITTLLSVATNITPLTLQPSLTQWKGTFTTPALQNFLYLIWDLRQTTALELCISEDDCATACEECYTPPPCNCGSWLVVNNNNRVWNSIGYVDCDGNNAIIGDEFPTPDDEFPAYGAVFICARDFPEDFREPSFTYIYLGCFCCSNQCVNFDVVSTSAATIEFLGLVDCGATTPSSVIFNPMSTRSLCVNDYFDAGYFTIPQGIADVELLDFQFQECGCTGICCSTYYFYSVSTQLISYIDCDGTLLEGVTVKDNSGLFICLSEIVDSGTCIVTQLNECQCCVSSCYTILATNNSASTINVTALPTTCFGSPTNIAAGTSKLICVGEGTNLTYSGGDAADLAMEFSECDCPPL
jgi:hypothetical protein